MYGWTIKDDEDLGKNRTKTFKKLVERSEKENYKDLPSYASDFTYFLVPGLYANNLTIKHMEDNIKLLESLGLDIIRLNINTGGTVKENAREIKDIIIEHHRNGGSKIVLIGHSKGAIDAATAISKYKLYKYVKGLILMQAPWAGTLIAEETGIMRHLSNFATMITGTNKQALEDLSYENRRKTIKKYPLDITKLKVLCVASSIGDVKSISQLPATILKRKYGVETDGIVGFEDAVIPGCDYVIIDKMAHSDSVLYISKQLSELYPGDMTYALIVMILNPTTNRNNDKTKRRTIS